MSEIVVIDLGLQRLHILIGTDHRTQARAVSSGVKPLFAFPVFLRFGVFVVIGTLLQFGFPLGDRGVYFVRKRSWNNKRLVDFGCPNGVLVCRWQFENPVVEQQINFLWNLFLTFGTFE